MQEAILIIPYAAIILSISGTISALSLTDEFAEIPSRAARDALHTSAQPAIALTGENWDILRYFGARKSTRWIIYHSECHMPAPIFLVMNKLYSAGKLTTG